MAKVKKDQRHYAAARPEDRRGVVVSIDLVQRRMERIEGLLINGASVTGIRKVALEEFGMKRSQTDTYIDRVRARWAEQDRTARPHFKAAAIRRLYGHIAEARRAGNWSSVAQFEKILASVQGTNEPIEVQLNIDATVTEAALHVVANLTPERRAALIADQRALRALAAKNTITVTVEAESVEVKPSK